MQQGEFEMETAAGYNAIARCRASGQILGSKVIETGIECLFMPERSPEYAFCVPE
jgi:hypothetical protein